MRTGRPRASTFWARVIVGPGCWEWVGLRDKKGYGLYHRDGGAERAHRVAFEFWNEGVKPTLNVLHKCDNRPCVRPNHLYEGTQSQNMKDMFERGRARRASGADAYNAALTKGQAEEVRASYLKVPTAELAKKYGVSLATIGRIGVGISYKKVEGAE